MNRPNADRLVLISGAVASGKTTAAQGLAAYARALGEVAAAVDMDDMIAIVAGSDWSLISNGERRRACRATASFVQSLFESGTQLVAIAGSTLSPYEWDELTRRLDAEPETLYVLLQVSLEEAVRRAKGDPGRLHTKDPAHVAKLAAAIDWSAVRRHDLEVQTDSMTPEDIVAFIARKIMLPLSSQGEGAGGEV